MSLEQDRYEIVDEADKLLSLRHPWDALYNQTPNCYFTQSFDWAWSSWMTVARARTRQRNLFCLVVRNGNRPVLIWPLTIHRAFTWTIAQPLGPETTEYSDVLVSADSDTDRRIAAAWQALQDIVRCDVLRLPFVRSESPLNRLVCALSGQKWAVSSTERVTTSYVEWHECPDWETYYRSLERKQRRDIARRRRRMIEHGRVTFEPEIERSQMPTVIDWILEHKRQWLTRTGLENRWLGTKEYRDFLITIASLGGPSGRLIASVLKLDDNIIAASLSRIDKVRLEASLTAFDPVYHMHAPSHILYEDLLKWSFNQGLVVDLRLGDEAFKEYWSACKLDAISYEIANSRWGSFYFLAKQSRRAAVALKTALVTSAREAFG